MKLSKYIYDRKGFLIMDLMVVLCVMGIMNKLKLNIFSIEMVFLVWSFSMGIYIVLEYLKEIKYLQYLKECLEIVDRKTVVTSLLGKVDFYEAQVFNECLKNIIEYLEKETEVYKKRLKEYIEYIELWVHEIKIPVTTIKLIAESNPIMTDEVEDEIEEINDYIEKVLYYAKSTEISNDYIIKELSLEKIVKTAIKERYKDFINKKVKIRLEDVDEKIISDEKWLLFIFNQVIQNAIKYSKENNAEIKIQKKIDKQFVTVIVEDNGIGILKKDIDKIFMKGFSGENGRLNKRSTGVGLYICKKMSEKLGIEIKVDSEFDNWTRISLIIPRKC